MLSGYVGKWLRVDLTNGVIQEEKQEEDKLKKFGGQLGIGLKILWDEVPAGVKGTDPENRLIIATGPLTGTSTHCGSNFSAITRNPGYGNPVSWAASHGFWGARLKFAGYDGIIIQGRSEKPVYLWIHENQYELRPADKYWGKTDCFETEDQIIKEVGESKASVLTIGPAGENLVESSTAQNDHGHFLGNGNIGAVMGSKNLKAIAVYGKGNVPIADPERAKETGKVWKEESMTMPNTGAITDMMGTVGQVGALYPLGDLPIKNMTVGTWDKVDNINAPALRAWEHKWKPCYGCSIKHVYWTTVGDGPYKGFTCEEPEYEGLSTIGSNLGIGDAGSIAWLNNENDRLGFDVNWAGTVLGWCIEAFERGILTKEDTDGIELKWGDEKACAALLNKIAYKEGKFGAAIASGMRNAVREFGGAEGESFYVHFKGKGNKGHDVRSLWGMFLGLCIANRGAAWESNGMDMTGQEDRFDPAVKPLSARNTQIFKHFAETTGTCTMGWPNTTELMTEHLSAVTGYHMTVEDAMLQGERLTNLGRAFNVRHGFNPVDDLDVAPRLMNGPLEGGAAGHDIGPHLENMIKEYNKIMDYDWETGRPSQAKLKQLGLEEVAKELYA